ncbi:MAG: peptidoglycan-binding protein [Eubacteriales bacterium]
MKCYSYAVIQIALAEVGYIEKKSNSNLDSNTDNAGDKNYTKYARDLAKIDGFYNGNKNGYAWCDVFVDWCFVQAFGVNDAKRLLCQTGLLGAACKYSYNYYKSKGRAFTDPLVGDQIFFNDGSGNINHTGLVYDVDGKYVYTVEGNTSSASGVVANGGCVEKKKYKLGYQYIAGYGRPAYDGEKSYPKITVLEFQQAAIKDGYKFPKYGADGEWGSECESVAKKAIVKKRFFYTNKNLTKLVQRVVGVTVDGLCGNGTKSAIIAYQKSMGLVADGEVGISTWKKFLGVT